MPGVTDVGAISTGVAVRARTFGQCIDAVRALQRHLGPGTVAEESPTTTVLEELQAAELPLGLPTLARPRRCEAEFIFQFRSNSALETNCAVADVRDGRAEIWGAYKTPIIAQQAIAAEARHAAEQRHRARHRGRRLLRPQAVLRRRFEAAEVSKAFGKPVKLMWHRTDDSRQGRTHPMSTSRVRATYARRQRR